MLEKKLVVDVMIGIEKDDEEEEKERKKKGNDKLEKRKEEKGIREWKSL